MKMDTAELVVFGRFISVLILSFGLHCVTSSRDLALHKNALQSSTYGSNDAGRAVDGTPGRDIAGGHCSHTGTGHNKAWWKVDLGDVYRVQTINITYRHDYPYRLYGYYLYVTNHTEMTVNSNGNINSRLEHLCYHDNGSALPNYFQSRPCPFNGRYVIFYNERPIGHTTHPPISNEAYIELCEVQVFGCPVNHFGPDCSSECHCMMGGCNPDTGQCDVIGCQSGWMGTSCSATPCEADRFGANCEFACHCQHGSCNSSTGVCDRRGCVAGWKGPSCYTAANDLAFKKLTNQSSVNDATPHVDDSNKAIDGLPGEGSCSHTYPRAYTKAWWRVDLQNIYRINTIKLVFTQSYRSIIRGYYLYVSNVSDTDSFSKAYTCFHDETNSTNYLPSHPCSVNGRYVIVYNSRPYYDTVHHGVNHMKYAPTEAVVELCDVQVLGCLPNHFAANCNSTCHCKIGGCHSDTGVCDVPGCQDGWTAENCSVCVSNHYGSECRQECHCMTEGCDIISGTCTQPGCQSGWTGDSCDTMCDINHFGPDCTQQCHCKTEGCNLIDGTCNVTGCHDGWTGKSCDQMCDRNHFGPDCTKQCHCKTEGCNRVGGACNATGCQDGWMGKSCDQVCDRNHFGPNCTQQCHCKTEGCNRINGTCNVIGCQGGWTGASCDQMCGTNHFGPDCTQQCHCKTEGCNRIDGTCNVTGCKDGWMGASCDQVCDRNHFGPNCTQQCHCKTDGCNRINGTCNVTGCQKGWMEESCDQRQSETSSESSPSSGALIGGVVAAVVALLVVIVIVVVVRKRQMPSKERPVGDNDLSPENQHSIKRENVYVNISPKNTKKKKPYEVKTPKVMETDIDEDEVIYVNGPHDEDVRGETKLLVVDLKEIVKTKHINDMYEVEFKSLPHGLKHPHSNAKLEQNLLRNRFKTTFPYDHSRVVLKKEKKGSTDYINANYIDGVRDKKTYIATQGPKTMTLEEFWRMAWQNNCGKIVMLANLIEVGKVKCATYWTGSEGTSLELDLFQVTLQEEVAYAFYTTRKLAVKNKQTNSTRQISQYHFTRWPDHGVPEPFELLQFYKRVKDDRTNHKGPLIVHCSAGIGRTGTFIGLDALLLEGNTSGEIDVFAYTEKMRKDRMNMIQTADQYAMLHDVLLEGLTVVTSSISKTDFSRAVNDMCDKDIPTQQYALLNSARPEYSTTEYSTAIENEEKNRNQCILAVEKYTIRLRTTAKEYINAVNIPGYRIPYGYILTQHPLDNTVIDFLSLISQERSDTVVSIGRLQNNPCWPTKQGSVAKFGNFVVTNVHCDHHAVGPKRVEERQLTIVNKEIGADTKISLLETPSWGSSMPNSSFMLEFIQIIQSRRGIDASPVIITCSDGATESGLLCTLCNVMERLVVDGDVDIMAAARQLQIRRPQCFPNKDQYVFCYNLVKEHLEESSVYANV